MAEACLTSPHELAQRYLLGMSLCASLPSDDEAERAYGLASAAWHALSFAAIETRQDALGKVIALRRRLLAVFGGEEVEDLQVLDQVAGYLRSDA